MKRLAISYLRFSSSKQRKGASYTRQIEATEAYCRNHGLTLVDQLEDLGVSGWNGANLDDTAALGGFLKLAQDGRISKGTTLIIENLDRLSRAKITKAVNVLTGILLLDIAIVTTMDGKRYAKDCEPTDLLIAVTILSRGNEESETKSKRVKDAWIKKRAAINRGEFVKMTQHPNWLEVKDGKYVPKTDAAKTVKAIFELYASGKGSHVIAKELNNDGVHTYSRRGEKFTFSSIERLLKSEAVIGTCDVVDPPKKGYWPRVISDELWYKVQALRQQNNHYKGTRNDVQKVNFLGGLAVCAKCEAKGIKSSMVRYSCTGKNGQRYHYLTCHNAKYGEHPLNLAPYQAIQESFISGMSINGFLEPFLKAKTDTRIQDKTPELEGKLIELNQRIARLARRIEETDNNQDVVNRLNELQAERKAIQAEIEAEAIRVKGATNANAAYYELLKHLDKKIQDNAFRMSLRNFLRTVIDKVKIGRDEQRNPFYSVHFKKSKDVVTVEHSNSHKPDKSYRVSLNGTWQVGVTEFA
ncbi:MAG TPA: recombinase family protein [Candidatus Paceibacterota bacterium]|nr:recombinase family protein [Verrucomicrobiota bacterium]HSA11590.1 recombinase family protein [Candidatus Paceibacterota bacterium]